MGSTEILILGKLLLPTLTRIPCSGCHPISLRLHYFKIRTIIIHTYKSDNDTTVSTLVWTLWHVKCCKGGTGVDIVVSGMTHTNIQPLVTHMNTKWEFMSYNSHKDGYNSITRWLNIPRVHHITFKRGKPRGDRIVIYLTPNRFVPPGYQGISSSCPLGPQNYPWLLGLTSGHTKIFCFLDLFS